MQTAARHDRAINDGLNRYGHCMTVSQMNGASALPTVHWLRSKYPAKADTMMTPMR